MSHRLLIIAVIVIFIGGFTACSAHSTNIVAITTSTATAHVITTQVWKDNGEFKTLQNDIPVLLSAPHAKEHVRNGELKKCDYNTGRICEEVCAISNSYGIVKTGGQEDPNFSYKSSYRDTAVELVKSHHILAVLDIHGMKDSRECDICIGINGGVNIQCNFDLLEKIKNIFEENGLIVSIDKPFSASGKQTVSSTISSECGIPSFQIEIARKFRESVGSPEFDKIIEALTEIVQLLSQS